MRPSDLVLVTSDYKVVALNKGDGVQIWETMLVTGFLKPLQPFITLVMDETGVYAATNSEMFCLELATGAIVWRTKLNSGKWIKMQRITSIALSGNSSPAAPAAARMKMDANQQSRS